jgi:hypothetical protein
MGLERARRRRDLGQDALHQRVGADAVGQGLVRQHDAVPQHVGHQVGHVLGQRVAAPAQEGEGARAFDQVDGRARAGAEGDVARLVGQAVPRRLARGRHQLHRVLDQRRVDVQLAALALQHGELLGGRDRHHVDARPGHALDDHELLVVARVADQHLHHEAVDLRLGQRVGALGLDRVLSGHHQEGLGHLVRLARDGDLPLLHHLEQRALHLGRRAVDLVGQQQVGEHRPERRGELAALLVVDARAHEVRRHEVGRELDALELAAQRLRQRLHRQRLGQPGHALDQQVALRQHGDQHALEEAVLPDDDALDLVEHALHQRADVGAAVDSIGHGNGSSAGVRRGAGRRPRRRSRSAPRSRCR